MTTMVTISCDNCGDDFERSKARVNETARLDNNSFCSRACEGDHKTLDREERICKTATCENKFRVRITDRKKYCSRSCAASVNNHKYKKRQKKTYKCKHCKVIVPSRRTVCDDCQPVPITLLTLAQLRENCSISDFHSRIRGHARKIYSGSMACRVCKYSKFVEIAHIRGVADFQPSTLIKEVNHQRNLVALCRNHHWEFDNGALSVADLGIEPN